MPPGAWLTVRCIDCGKIMDVPDELYRVCVWALCDDCRQLRRVKMRAEAQ